MTLSVTSISPYYGPDVGGKALVVNGTGFTGATAVKFISRTNRTIQVSAGFVVVDSTEISIASSPALAAGSWDTIVFVGSIHSPFTYLDEYITVSVHANALFSLYWGVSSQAEAFDADTFASLGAPNSAALYGYNGPPVIDSTGRYAYWVGVCPEGGIGDTTPWGAITLQKYDAVKDLIEYMPASPSYSGAALGGLINSDATKAYVWYADPSNPQRTALLSEISLPAGTQTNQWTITPPTDYQSSGLPWVSESGALSWNADQTQIIVPFQYNSGFLLPYPLEAVVEIGGGVSWVPWDHGVEGLFVPSAGLVQVSGDYLLMASFDVGILTVMDIATGNELWTAHIDSLEPVGAAQTLWMDPLEEYVYMSAQQVEPTVENYSYQFDLLTGSLVNTVANLGLFPNIAVIPGTEFFVGFATSIGGSPYLSNTVVFDRNLNVLGVSEYVAGVNWFINPGSETMWVLEGYTTGSGPTYQVFTLLTLYSIPDMTVVRRSPAVSSDTGHHYGQPWVMEFFPVPPAPSPYAIGVPTRQKPRDDNLALGAVRQSGTRRGPSSVQNSVRTGVRGTYS